LPELTKTDEISMEIKDTGGVNVVHTIFLSKADEKLGRTRLVHDLTVLTRSKAETFVWDTALLRRWLSVPGVASKQILLRTKRRPENTSSTLKMGAQTVCHRAEISPIPLSNNATDVSPN
jgi:hypothetical protein